MPLRNAEILELTGLSSHNIGKCLQQKGLMSYKNRHDFFFYDASSDRKYLLHSFLDSKRTFWKYEAREYLIHISKDCREILNKQIKIKTSWVQAEDLPFVKGKEYIIFIKNIGKRTMLFESELGIFRTQNLGGNRIQENKKYIMIMNASTTTFNEYNKTLEEE